MHIFFTLQWLWSRHFWNFFTDWKRVCRKNCNVVVGRNHIKVFFFYHTMVFQLLMSPPISEHLKWPKYNRRKLASPPKSDHSKWTKYEYKDLGPGRFIVSFKFWVTILDFTKLFPSLSRFVHMQMVHCEQIWGPQNWFWPPTCGPSHDNRDFRVPRHRSQQKHVIMVWAFIYCGLAPFTKGLDKYPRGLSLWYSEHHVRPWYFSKSKCNRTRKVKVTTSNPRTLALIGCFSITVRR